MFFRGFVLITFLCLTGSVTFGHFGDWTAFFLLRIRKHLTPGEVFQERSMNVTDESRGDVGDE